MLSIKGFTEIMKGKEGKIDTVFLRKPELIKWVDDFYWNLSNEEREAGCIHLSRIRMMEGKPIMVEQTFLSNLDLKGFCNAPLVNKSLFDTLIVNHDIEMTHVVQKFRAISASTKLAKSLNLNEGHPVLEIIRKLKTTKPGFYVYSFSYCNTNDFTIEA